MACMAGYVTPKNGPRQHQDLFLGRKKKEDRVIPIWYAATRRKACSFAIKLHEYPWVAGCMYVWAAHR